VSSSLPTAFPIIFSNRSNKLLREKGVDFSDFASKDTNDCVKNSIEHVAVVTRAGTIYGEDVSSNGAVENELLQSSQDSVISEPVDEGGTFVENSDNDVCCDVNELDTVLPLANIDINEVLNVKADEFAEEQRNDPSLVSLWQQT